MESAQQVAGGTNRCQCQTEVAKAHAVPQGVCENLINCWQTSRKMGQSGVLLQVFVKEAEMEGLDKPLLKWIITVPWTWAILKEGTRSFCCTEAKVRRGVPRGVSQEGSQGIDAQNRRS